MTKTLTRNEVVEAVSRLYVRLASDDVTPSLLQNVDEARASLAQQTDAYLQQVSKIWDHAASAALAHVKVVVQNNPKADIADLLARPDVQQALSLPFTVASQDTARIITDAWNSGVTIGQSHALSDLSDLGMTAPSLGDVATTTLDSLLTDAEANAQAARERLVGAITGAQPGKVLEGLQSALDDLRRRAVLGVDAARTMGSTEAQLGVYEQAQKESGQQIRLLWVTHFRPTTCATCAALHGKNIPLGGTFSDTATFSGKAPKTYLPLAGPPRHPNCGCRVVAYVMVPKGTITAMQTYANGYWSKEGGG